MILEMLWLTGCLTLIIVGVAGIARVLTPYPSRLDALLKQGSLSPDELDELKVLLTVKAYEEELR
jgi:hypothetical protein